LKALILVGLLPDSDRLQYATSGNKKRLSKFKFVCSSGTDFISRLPFLSKSTDMELFKRHL
jgi:hypothetical protein